ncbi:fatty acid desaturase family protein [Ramlibacter tataouinensis]|uniref:fatty acid desaturase family protein n=1 Tax=Ramlibacter tataouinensis TaxID=94132 RepID=UPI0005A05E6F|nr:fatty acid desaturase [Ramlibacter tataouinensis]
MSEHRSLPSAPRELELRAARAVIARELGTEQLARLHAPNLALDLAAIVGSIALFLVCAWKLATGSFKDPLWWLCLVVQGNLIIVMAILNHDAFVHRKLFPQRLRWVVSSVLAWPAQLRSALYESQHLKHHRALGTDGDTEMHKQGIDTRLRRLVYATPALIAYRAIFYRSLVSQQRQTLPADPQKPPQARAAHGDETRLRWEKSTRYVIWGLVAASAAWDWRLVVFGYLLPFAVVTPPLNTVRIVLEHFDLDRNNPLWVGTFYRTGLFTRVMFWWGTGDCHLVHHYYANIPFYRMPAALRLVRPILQREGVYEHRSLLRLLWQWFSASRGHWSVPPGSAPVKSS